GGGRETGGFGLGFSWRPVRKEDKAGTPRVRNDPHGLRTKLERVDDVGARGLGDREDEIRTLNPQPNLPFPEEPAPPRREQQLRYSAIGHVVLRDDDPSRRSDGKVCVVGRKVEDVELTTPCGDRAPHAPNIAEGPTAVRRRRAGGGGARLYDDAGSASGGGGDSAVRPRG